MDDAQDQIAQIIRGLPPIPAGAVTPAMEVRARFPSNYELGLPDEDAFQQWERSMNGPEGFPNFNWVNPAGMDAFLESAPMSTNIEDRRPDPDAFIRAILARGQ